MNFNVPSFQERRAKIKTIKDLDKQLDLAQSYVRRVRNASKKPAALDLKLSLGEKVREADAVLRQLRQSVFDIEDEINQAAV